MDVIQQLFVTSSIGISLEKDYYTSSELAFICKVENYSKVKSADIKLLSAFLLILSVNEKYSLYKRFKLFLVLNLIFKYALYKL